MEGLGALTELACLHACAGPPRTLREARLTELFKPLLRQQLLEIVDVWLPPEACSYRIAAIAITKRYAGGRGG
jgi:UbiD family decarboxylase